MNLDLHRRPPGRRDDRGESRAPLPGATDSARDEWDTAGGRRPLSPLVVIAVAALVAGVGVVSRGASTVDAPDPQQFTIERSTEPLDLAEPVAGRGGQADSGRADPDGGTPVVVLPWGRLPDAPFDAVHGSPIATLRWSVVTVGAQDDGLVLAEATLAGITGDGSIERRFAEMWTVLPASPLAARSSPYLRVVDDDRLLVWGGTDGTDGTGEPLLDGAVLDRESGRWDLVPELPATLAGARTAGWAGDRLVVVGVEEGTGPAAWSWTLGDGAWEAVPPPPVRDVVSVDGVVVGDTLVAYGVQAGEGTRRDEVFVVGYDGGDLEWRDYDVVMLRRIHEAVAVPFGSEVLVWGRPSTNSYDARPAGFVLDTETRVWKQARRAPLELTGGAPTVASDPRELSGAWAEDIAVIAGGRNAAMLAYTPSGRRWIAVTPPPATAGGQLAWAGRRLLRWGGDVAGRPVPQLWMLPARTDTRDGRPRTAR